MSDLIPPGHYLARGVVAFLSETKAGQPQAAATIVILEEGPYSNTQMPWFGPLGDHVEEKHRIRTIESLRSLGWTGDDLSENPLPGIGSLDVSVEVKHEEYQGVVRARVAWINKAGATFAKPIEANKGKAFAAQMKGLIAKVKAGSGGGSSGAAPAQPASGRPAAPARSPAPTRQPQTAQPAMGVSADDIPFSFLIPLGASLLGIASSMGLA